MAAVAGTTVAGLWWQLFRRSLPRHEGRLHVAGVEGAVDVRRDRWGVPHVHADTLHDAWFGEGFCHGQDRLWQLDLYRRVASGRTAEIGGAAALAPDRLMRKMGLSCIANRKAAAI